MIHPPKRQRREISRELDHPFAFSSFLAAYNNHPLSSPTSKEKGGEEIEKWPSEGFFPTAKGGGGAATARPKTREEAAAWKNRPET